MNNLSRDYFPLAKDFNQLLESFFQGQADSSFVATGTWAPPVDIREEKDRFVVIADIPGVSREDIQISLENNLLTIQGERHAEKSEEREGYSRRERTYGKCFRRFSLPQSADETKISAKCKNGVLEISIPKKQVAREKRIEIHVEE